MTADAPAKRPRRRASDRTGAPRPEPTLRILDTRILRGPNYWAHEPVVRMLSTVPRPYREEHARAWLSLPKTPRLPSLLVTTPE